MTNEEKLQELFKHLDTISYIDSSSIPNIDLYMDQVTTFMDEHLKKTKRYEDDKVLTKTMINNYAKNNLLPSPNKKKYSKDHVLLLIFIYYFKNLMSFHDIESLFKPLTSHHFSNTARTPLTHIYEEVFSLEQEQMSRLKEDVKVKFDCAKELFQDSDPEEQEYLRLFAFICELSFDIYMKKQMIEALTDQLREEDPGKRKK